MNGYITRVYAGAIFFIFCCFYLLIIGALFWIQIVQHDFYYTLGEKQYSITSTQFSPRAPILDRTGKNFLAMNKESKAAFILPNQIHDPEALTQFLKDYFPDAYARLDTLLHKKFMYIQRKLSPEQIACIQASSCTDIYILSEPSRFYPLPAASCIIGITDAENKGLFGMERYYNDLLTGTSTTVILEKDARSELFYFTKDTHVTGTAGKPLQLTIDSNIQFLTHQALHECVEKFGAKEGAALIMDPNTGQILAMVNIPSFDPHNTKDIDFNETKIRALTEQYELGSVFKVFAALAALEEGIVKPDELIDCKSSTTTYLNGRRINTVHAHGIIPFTDVVALSNNIGIAIVTQRLQDRLYDHYQQLGFGRKTGINLPGESSGFLNPPYNWSKQSAISLSYGYEVSATLLQLACAFSLIARNGVPVRPQLVFTAHDQEQEPYNSTNSLYSQQSIDAIKDILRRTTHYGTAKRAAIKGYTVMSKTGTANILDEDGIYNPRKNRYTCVAIIERGNYKRVIATFIQEANRPNLYAATVAAPLLEIIAEHMLIAEHIV
jgi:cell division protein FtsI (penicillin-binding protein 3)